jgi:hypothetical protein
MTCYFYNRPYGMALHKLKAADVRSISDPGWLLMAYRV